MTRTIIITMAALAATSALTCPPAAALAPKPAATPALDVKAQADAILSAAYAPQGPGAAAIITRHGRVIYTGGRGLADIDRHRAITPDTVFELGSIAKQFTAAVILQLVQEKRISLDDPLSRFFPDWPQPGANATVRQLLNHTSGIPDFSKIPGWISKNADRSITTEELLALTRSLPTKAAPGAKWEYSNGGYVILGGIVEKVTGKPWYDAVQERIARPLGLSSIRYAVGADPSNALAKRYNIDHGRAETAAKVHMSIAGAAGGLVGSVSDMAKWAHALHTGKVVSPALYAEMIRPAPLADGTTAPYGFALHLKKLVGHPVLEHGGAGRGIDTDSAYLPKDDVFVAVFANSDDLPTDASVVLRRLGALAVGSPLPDFKAVDVDPKTIEPAFGVYKGDNDPEIRFFSRDGRFYIARGDFELPLIAAGDSRFYSASDGLTWVRLSRGPGSAQMLELYGTQEAEPQRYARTGALPADAQISVPAAMLQSYVGEYQTETLAVTIRLAGAGWLEMLPKGQPAIAMRPVSNTEFMLDGNRMRLVFHPENGKADSFTMHRGARELHGKRIAK